VPTLRAWRSRKDAHTRFTALASCRAWPGVEKKESRAQGAITPDYGHLGDLILVSPPSKATGPGRARSSYDRTEAELRVEPLRGTLARFEREYNTTRPHQALGYRTPQQYLDERKVVVAWGV
jgi:transposase InsO family protein